LEPPTRLMPQKSLAAKVVVPLEFVPRKQPSTVTAVPVVIIRSLVGQRLMIRPRTVVLLALTVMHVPPPGRPVPSISIVGTPFNPMPGPFVFTADPGWV